jgi:Flp pilus assembly protein protease CpaA
VTALSKNARVAGLLYIVASAVGIVRLLYVPNALFVRGNAAATAANIAAHEPLFRFGIFCYLLGGVIWLFVPLALYRLLKGVDQSWPWPWSSWEV